MQYVVFKNLAVVNKTTQGNESEQMLCKGVYASEILLLKNCPWQWHFVRWLTYRVAFSGSQFSVWHFVQWHYARALTVRCLVHSEL